MLFGIQFSILSEINPETSEAVFVKTVKNQSQFIIVLHLMN